MSPFGTLPKLPVVCLLMVIIGLEAAVNEAIGSRCHGGEEPGALANMHADCIISSPPSDRQEEEKKNGREKEMTSRFMRGVHLKGPGGPEMLQYTTDVLTVPKLSSSKEILVKVSATALNRADTMQRKGHYPVPPGGTEILGLEAAGVVEYVGEDVKLWKAGDQVMALLVGGGYGEYAVAHETHCMPIPKEMPMEQAAAIPEVFLTAWQAIRFQASLQSGNNLLVHAGASGVGTAACQLARQMSAKSVTTSSEGKVESCQKFADFAVSRTKNETSGKLFADKVAAAIGPNSIDVIIDPVFGGGYLEEDAEVLRSDGQVVILAFMGGSQLSNFNAVPMFRKRAGIKFSTLRSQSDEYKGKLVANFTKEALAGFTEGKLAPVIDTVMGIEDIVKAHQRMDASDTVGKIVLKF